MNTEDPKFQNALHNLTTAFFNFLDVVNPAGVDQAADIRYIAQTMQHLASRMGSVSAPSGQPVAAPASEPRPAEPTAPAATVSTPAAPAPQPAPVQSSANIPAEPNLFREYPFYDKRSERYVFDRLRPDDGPNKYFTFRVDEKAGEGYYSMKAVQQGDWQTVFESKDRIIPSQVVERDGDIVQSASLVPVEPGIVKVDSTGRNWLIVKPCKVRITPA